MTTNDDIQTEQTPTGWIWIYQSAAGAYYRAPTSYKTKTLARKAGQHWLTRRHDPRLRGR